MKDKLNENTNKINWLINEKIKLGKNKLYKKAIVINKFKKEEVKK